MMVKGVRKNDLVTKVVSMHARGPEVRNPKAHLNTVWV